VTRVFLGKRIGNKRRKEKWKEEKAYCVKNKYHSNIYVYISFILQMFILFKVKKHSILHNVHPNRF
jgi:hypothetical protein